MTREEVDDNNPVALAIWEFENAINGTEADNSEYPNYCIHINEYKTALAALNEVGSPTTQTDAQHAKNLMSGALDGTDYADRLRWILSQAERVARVDTEDRAAVDRACALLKEIDNGFDKIRI